MTKKEILSRIKMIKDNLEAGPLQGMDKKACKADAHKRISELQLELRKKGLNNG